MPESKPDIFNELANWWENLPVDTRVHLFLLLIVVVLAAYLIWNEYR